MNGKAEKAIELISASISAFFKTLALQNQTSSEGEARSFSKDFYAMKRDIIYGASYAVIRVYRSSFSAMVLVPISGVDREQSRDFSNHQWKFFMTYEEAQQEFEMYQAARKWDYLENSFAEFVQMRTHVPVYKKPHELMEKGGAAM